MTHSAQPNGSRTIFEGGVFYPTGYIVVAFPQFEDADHVHRDFLAVGYEENDCTLATPQAVLAAAEGDFGFFSIIGYLGSTAQVREKQQQLARQGCHFLMIYASTMTERSRVLRALSRVPVRYAVYYGHLVIEDLIDLISSATADHECARCS